MINLQVSESLQDSSLEPLTQQDLFEIAAQQTLLYAGQGGEAELTVVLTDDAQIQDLNHQFRDVDAPTDVLSFPAGEVDLDTGNLYLGDIIISVPRAQAQAAAEGCTLEAELRLLVVHGALHLLGYDHADEQEKAAMWVAQKEILARLNS
jgi:probable rRNA maturation factor